MQTYNQAPHHPPQDHHDKVSKGQQDVHSEANAITQPRGIVSRQASCSCGQLSIVCEGDPGWVSVCHCLNCQRRTGSVFSAQARWKSEQVRIKGHATEWVLTGDAGGKATFRFCPTCGATVYYELDSMPGVIAVPVGAFADPGFPPPVFSVYEARKHAWISMPENIEHIE